MDGFDTPANSNTALSQLLNNPKRDLATKSIDQITTLLDAADVPREMRVEVIFDKLVEMIIPDTELDTSNATIWYAQLNRMRDVLQNQIDLIETELDKAD